MTDPPLFPEMGPVPGQEIQLCDACLALEVGTVDTLRVLGWTAYAGTSVTGKPIKVRECPACRRGKRGDDDSAGDRLAAVPQVHPRLPGTDR